MTNSSQIASIAASIANPTYSTFNDRVSNNAHMWEAALLAARAGYPVDDLSFLKSISRKGTRSEVAQRMAFELARRGWSPALEKLLLAVIQVDQTNRRQIAAVFAQAFLGLLIRGENPNDFVLSTIARYNKDNICIELTCASGNSLGFLVEKAWVGRGYGRDRADLVLTGATDPSLYCKYLVETSHFLARLGLPPTDDPAWSRCPESKSFSARELALVAAGAGKLDAARSILATDKDWSKAFYPGPRIGDDLELLSDFTATLDIVELLSQLKMKRELESGAARLAPTITRWRPGPDAPWLYKRLFRLAILVTLDGNGEAGQRLFMSTVNAVSEDSRNYELLEYAVRISSENNQPDYAASALDKMKGRPGTGGQVTRPKDLAKLAASFWHVGDKTSATKTLQDAMKALERSSDCPLIKDNFAVFFAIADSAPTGDLRPALEGCIDRITETTRTSPNASRGDTATEEEVIRAWTSAKILYRATAIARSSYNARSAVVMYTVILDQWLSGSSSGQITSTSDSEGLPPPQAEIGD
jgi:hypothetical protein